MPIILATWKAEIGRIAVWDQKGQKFSKTPFQQKKAGSGGVHLLPHLQQEAWNKRSMIQNSLDKK
jgi:hypothetical protein